ncbi:MFS transporter [Agromyces indicus]|uniref:MFS transporter n=1 Tax=Agromyces indicus TaxID=758919 RepID=UPI00286E4720|nr:MFS transporter [Agromyces indicus]
MSGNRTIFVRLTLMMLLEFMVFGSWFATFGLVLATNGLADIIGLAYSLAAVAAIVSPMFLGAIADRFLASQKALGIAHILGGLVMLSLPLVVTAGSGAVALGLIFAYMIFFQPTLGLTNSIAFRHLGENQKLFPYIRVFGTLGWVIAGLGVGALGLSASVNLFYVTAGASIALGLYAFTLPSTPAPAKGVRFSIGDLVGAKAFTLLRYRNFAVLMICALLTAISLGVYNAWASPFLGALGIENVAGVLAIGQAGEVLFIVTIPLVLKYVGMKWALLAGMVMWGVRFALFIVAADGQTWVAILAIALQGICVDFFLVLAAMYIGRVAPVQFSAQAQSMLILVISGFGQFFGSLLSGWVFANTVAANPDAGPTAWTPMWLIPIVSAILTAIIWTVFFRYNRKEPLTILGTDEEAPARDSAVAH